MADTLQHGSITGNASVRQRISGEVVIGGKVMKELRFLPYSEFPEIGREETLYIDTDNNAMYYYDGSAYVALSGGGGGGTDNYNALSNKPSVNSVTLIGNKTSSELGLQELISDLSAIRSGATSGSTAVQPETLETALSEKQDTINDLDDIRTGAGLGETAVQPSDMETALADKQDVISDLSSIRSGAASGATAVQPSDMETALSGKQDVISDLQTIRSGAALGATAVQPADMESALADKQDVISDLDTIRSGATAGNTALQPEDIDTLPTDGSSNPVSSGGTYNFVNSSIATNTAYFIGTFASVAELEAYTGTVTNNDYAFVTSTDSAGNTLYNRYKYNAATQVWSFEYAVNNTAFTAAQWAAIQSGMTSADKTKLDGIEQGATKTVIDTTPTSGSSNAVSSGGVHTALSGKQDTIADLSDIRSGASAGATAVQPSALNDYQTKLSATNKLDPSFIDYDASHRAVSDTEKSTWNGKQSALTTEQLAAVNSGINSADVAQIETNKNNILLIAQNGVVNILANTAVTTTVERNGLTYTVNADKSVTVTGNASAYYAFTIAGSRTYANAMPLKRGTYIIKAGIAFDSSKPIFVQFGVMTSSEASISWQNIYDTNKELVVNNDTTRIVYELYNPSGSYSGYNATFYPMILDKSLYDAGFTDYQPYAKTNRELTVENDSQQSEIDYAVNTGAKNLLKITASSQTHKGVTFTVNDDQTVTVNGTNDGTGASTFVIVPNEQAITIPDGNYILSGCPTGGGASVPFDLRWYMYSSGKSAYDSGNGASVEKSGNGTGSNIAIVVKTGQTANNLTFKPMLRPSAITDPTYVPYALSNPVITPALIKQVDSGSKNLLDLNTDFTTYENKGITYKNNSDGTIKVSGTSSSADSYITLYDRNTDNLFGIQKGETVVIRSTSDNVSVNLVYKKSGGGYGLTVYGYKSSPGWFTVPSDFAGFLLRVGVPRNGTTVNEDVGGMICTAADYAVSPKIVPYRPSWQELYEMIQALQNNS